MLEEINNKSYIEVKKDYTEGLDPEIRIDLTATPNINNVPETTQFAATHR